MEREVEVSIFLSVELILTSILLGFIVVLALIGTNMANNKNLNDSYNMTIQANSKLYYYNNKIITGSDAIELMLTYTQTYDYIYIIYDSVGNVSSRIEISRAEEEKSGDFEHYWSEQSLRDTLKGYEDKPFIANVIQDKATGESKAIQFEYKP